MKKDQELVKKNKSGLFEMKFVRKAKKFNDFLGATNKLATPNTEKNTPAADNVTLGDTSKQQELAK